MEPFKNNIDGEYSSLQITSAKNKFPIAQLFFMVRA